MGDAGDVGAADGVFDAAGDAATRVGAAGFAPWALGFALAFGGAEVLTAEALAATRGFTGATWAAAFFAVGFAAGFLPAAGLETAFAGDFRAAGGADFFAATGRADFFAAVADVLRTGRAAPWTFAPCFAPLPELFTFLGATHRLLAAARPAGIQSYFDVAR